MWKNIIKNRMDKLTRKIMQDLKHSETGFTLMEVLVAAGIIGIMAAMAVPRFNDAVASANTAKISSDLATIDSAIAMFDASENTTTLITVSQLSDYIADAGNLKPPTGKCFLRDGSTLVIDGSKGYTIDTTERRGVYEQKHSGDFGKATAKKSS